MAKEKDPAFLMYSKDWLEGTADLMPDEKGVYIDLLCHQHQRQGLPLEHDRLARMVGLAAIDFEKIWLIIKDKFVERGGKLFNPKLTKVTSDRELKAFQNKILGIFSYLLRKSKLSHKNREILKGEFNVSTFLNETNEQVNEVVTKWYTDRSAALENGNANANTIVLEFEIIEEYKEVLGTWLTYKKNKGQSYKNQDSIQQCYNKLLKLSDGNLSIAEQIITEAMSNNYAGFFALKGNGIKPSKMKITVDAVNQYNQEYEQSKNNQ